MTPIYEYYAVRNMQCQWNWNKSSYFFNSCLRIKVLLEKAELKNKGMDLS